MDCGGFDTPFRSRRQGKVSDQVQVRTKTHKSKLARAVVHMVVPFIGSKNLWRLKCVQGVIDTK